MATAWGNTPLTNRGVDILVSGAASLSAAGTNQTLGLAVDLDNGRMWGRVGAGVWSGTSGNPATNTGGNNMSGVTGAVFPAWSVLVSGMQITANFGATAFERDIPSGFSAWGSTTTWDSSNKDASITLSNGNLTAAGTVATWRSVRGTTSHTTGKWYFELNIEVAGNQHMCGVENASGVLNSFLGSTVNGAGYNGDGNFYTNAGSVTGLPAVLGRYCNAWRSIRSTISHFTGKFYVEFTCDVLDAGNGWIVGVTNVSGPLVNFLGSDNNSVGIQAQASVWKNGSGTGFTFTPILTATHVLCVAIDLTNNKIWARRDNGAWSHGGGTGDPATNTDGQDIASVNDGVGVFLGFSPFDPPSTFDAVTANFGASAFAFTPPSGFVAWDIIANTTLPTSRTGMPRALRVR